MGLAAMMANIMSQDKIFAGDKQRSGMAFNPDYKPARDRKELRKFRIKGEEVEAYSAEIISVRLSPDKTPIAYENKVRCLMLSGLSREEAEKVALEPMDLELYYEIGAGLMAVDPAAVESGTIRSPYTGELYHENSYT